MGIWSTQKVLHIFRALFYLTAQSSDTSSTLQKKLVVELTLTLPESPQTQPAEQLTNGSNPEEGRDGDQNGGTFPSS